MSFYFMWLLRDLRSAQGPDLGSPGPDGSGWDLLDIRMPPTTWHLTGTSRLDAEHLGELSLLYRQSQIGGLGSYHFAFGWKKAHPTLASGQ